MTAAKSANHAKTWTQPELVKLGKIADVAGAPSGVNEGPNHS